MQVLSKSVSDALLYFGDPTTQETQKFVLQFDKFFDCLNVRNLDEWALKKKPDLKPYSSPDDDRLQVNSGFCIVGEGDVKSDLHSLIAPLHCVTL